MAPVIILLVLTSAIFLSLFLTNEACHSGPLFTEHSPGQHAKRYTDISEYRYFRV